MRLRKEMLFFIKIIFVGPKSLWRSCPIARGHWLELEMFVPHRPEGRSTLSCERSCQDNNALVSEGTHFYGQFKTK